MISYYQKLWNTVSEYLIFASIFGGITIFVPFSIRDLFYILAALLFILVFYLLFLKQNKKIFSNIIILLILASITYYYKLHYVDNNLFSASANGTAEELQIILNNGNDINSRSEHGLTPLMYAIKFNKDFGAIKYIISRGANINAVSSSKNDNSCTPLHFVSKYRNDDYDLLKVILNAKADVNVQDSDGSTPLHFFSYYNVENKFIELLLDYGARIDIVDDKKMSALHYAIFSQNQEEKILKTVSYLISIGAIVDSKDINDRTPLYFAVERNYTKIVNFLISHNANINILSYGKNVLSIAQKNNNVSLIELLKKNGAIQIDELEYARNTGRALGARENPTKKIYENDNIKILRGKWNGHYFASQGKTNCVLEIISIKNVNEIEAIFSFFPTFDNPSAPSGSYKMKGRAFYDNRIVLKGVEWIKHPPGYVFLNINGVIDFKKQRIVSNETINFTLKKGDMEHGNPPRKK